MIQVRELGFGYDDPVLEGVSLRIEDGESVLLAGPNGSGKTTLVRQFNALLEPDTGEVLIDGRRAVENPVYARTSVGMVFQTARDQFVAATVGADVAFGPENLGLDRAEIDRRVESALAAVNMAGRREERIDTLSDGEQARVAVAGALAMEPTHLVLDEPFAGLDWPARRSLLARLDSLAEAGTSLILVTHDVADVLERVDRVVGLREGRVAFTAGPERARELLPEIDVRVPAW